MLLQKTLSEWLPARHQNQKHVHLEIEQQLLGEANLNLGAFSSGFIKVKQPERGMLNVVMDKNDVSIREQLRIGGKGGASFERSRFQLRHAIQTVERLQMAAKNTHELVREILSKPSLQPANMDLVVEPAQPQANSSRPRRVSRGDQARESSNVVYYCDHYFCMFAPFSKRITYVLSSSLLIFASCRCLSSPHGLVRMSPNTQETIRIRHLRICGRSEVSYRRNFSSSGQY